MKILYITQAPAPYKTEFCNDLGKKVELTVLYEQKLSNDRNKEWQTRYKAKNFKEIYKEDITNNKYLGKEIKEILNGDYDIIDISGWGTIFNILVANYLKRKKIPFVFGLDGGIINNHENKFKYYIKKNIINKGNYFISSGSYTNKFLMHYKVLKNKIFNYPFTSIREEDIIKEIPTLKEKKEIRKKLNIKEKKVVISVGSFIPRKGYDILLNSCDSKKDIGIYLIGGKPSEELSEIVKNKNLKNVHFIDFLDKKELAEYYLAADLFVFPTREDIWGLVINEAMAYGLPIVSTDNCIAAKELVKNNENGFIVPVEDGKKLWTKINYILNDTKLKNKMSNESLRKIQEYTIENMAQKYYEIFLKIEKLNKNRG